MAALVIGIAGGTGSGKTTVTRRIAEAIPPHGVAVIEHDSYYRDRSHMTPEERAQVNFDHPDALETDLLVEHLEQLRRGESVDLPIYDFATHTRTSQSVRLEPRPVVLVEGILTFVDARLRSLLDMKIFVDTDPDIRLMRRIRRDIEERGRDFESVRQQYYATVRPMHLQFVEPSKRHADIVIPEGGDNHVALDLVIGKARRVIEEV